MPGAYDELPFESRASPERHPDRLAVVGALRGITSLSVRDAKILELGCGTGRNLIAIAENLKGSECVGLDVSKNQIEVAKGRAEDVGLKNVRFICSDIRSLPSDLGQFDFVICHGVFSWVDADVRAHLLSLLKNVLNEDGLAMLSFLALPGGSPRLSVQRALVYGDDSSADTSFRLKQARETIQTMLEKQVDDYSPHGQLLREELRLLSDQSDSLILHELLNPNLTGFFLSDFVSLLTPNSLHYVGDARAYRPLIRSVLDYKISDSDLSASPETHDLLFPRVMHSAVISKKTPSFGDLEDFSAFYVSSTFVPDGDKPQLFHAPDGSSIPLDDKSKASALKVIADAWPVPIRLAEAQQAAKKYINGEDALRLFLSLVSDGFADLHASDLEIGLATSTNPLVPSCTRLELSNRNLVTNLRHEYSEVSSLEKLFALECDGKKPRRALEQLALQWIESGELELTGELAASNPKVSEIVPALVEEVLFSLQDKALIARGKAVTDLRTSLRSRRAEHQHPFHKAVSNSLTTWAKRCFNL